MPALRWLTRDPADTDAQAQRLLPVFSRMLGDSWTVNICDCMSQIGSGALPVDSLPSRGIAIRRASRKGADVAQLAARFRQLRVPVIGHIRDNALVFDLRCLDREEEFINQINGLQSP